MGHPISMDQLKIDVGLMVEKMTQITIMFRRIKLRMEEYVCLKVYILLNKGNNAYAYFINDHTNSVYSLIIFFPAICTNRGGAGEYTRALCTSTQKLSTTYSPSQSW